MKKYIRTIAFVIVLGLLIQFPQNVFALTEAQLQQQKANLQAQQKAAQQQADQKAQQAAAFQQQVDAAQKQIDETQSALAATGNQISDTEKKIADLESQIQVQEDYLAGERSKLNDVASVWYMEDQQGLLGAVLTSQNLSEMMDQQQYYDSVKQQILAIT